MDKVEEVSALEPIAAVESPCARGALADSAMADDAMAGPIDPGADSRCAGSAGAAAPASDSAGPDPVGSGSADPDGCACPALDLSWLLGRAAARLAAVVDAAATGHGVGMRAQLVLSALSAQGGRTQLALGAALQVDKTTLTTELDRLEACGLIRRRPDPNDRRVRIPEITEAGRSRQADVDAAVSRAMAEELSVLSEAEHAALAVALRRLVDRPPVKGSGHGGCGSCDPVS